MLWWTWGSWIACNPFAPATPPSAAPTPAPPIEGAASPGEPASAHGRPQASPSPNAASFAHKYLVIVGTDKDPEALDKAEEKLRHVPGVTLEPVRLVSTDFSGLRPCWNLLVAKAFVGKDQAIRYSEELKKAGVESYVRATRTYLGHLKGRASTCGTDEGIDAWIDSGGLLLGEDPENRADRQEFVAIDEPRLGGLARGDRVRVVSLSGADAVCTVTGFYARGVDGMSGWPDSPGCNGSDLVAELDEACPGGAFAVRENAPKPIVYHEASAGEVPSDVVEALKAELLASEQVRDQRQSLERSVADGLATTTTEELAPVRVWAGPAGKVVLLRVDGFAPYAEVECGIDGDRARVHRAVLLTPDGRRIELATAATGAGAAVEHVVDLDADGRPELWWSDYDAGTSTSALEGTVAPARTVYCGCLC